MHGLNRGLVAAVVLGAAASLCPSSHAQDRDWARKMFDKLSHNFGDVAKGAKTEHRFRITNVYKEDMQISSVRSSCGCTAPVATKRLIKSGETAELVAAFNTERFEGQHGATLTVRFAPPFAAEVRLRVDGYVRRDVVIHPGRIEFGSVDSAVGVEKKVKVYYAGRSNWEVSEVRTTNEDLDADLNLVRRGGGRVEYDLTFRLKPGARSGYINDQLTLVTNDLSRKYIPLSVEGRVTSSLTVSPASLQLGVVRPGETVTKQIVVRGTSPFTIMDVRCVSGDACFSFQSGERPRSVHLIPVTYTAEKGTGKFVDQILIKVDGHDESPQVTAHVEVVQD